MNHPNRNKRAAKRGPHPTGAEIRQTREEAGQTQAEAAASILVATKTWQDYELERRKMPPGLWEYYCLQCAFPQVGRLIRRWRSANVANRENEMSEVRFQKYESTKCPRCGSQVIGLGGKSCCEGLSMQQIKDRLLNTHKKVVRNLAAGRDALDGIEDYNGIGPRALRWLEAAGVVESGGLTRLGRELLDAINAPRAEVDYE